jgi:type VI secretion system secreted protein Hcp
MFLKIEGVDGEAETGGRGHEDWIEIVSFTWGASRMPTAAGRARGPGRASFSDMTVVKRVDASSPSLYLASASGRRLPSAVLEVRRPGTGTSYYTIRMEGVRISSVSVSSSKDSAEPMEEITLSYGKISWEYVPSEDAGRGARHEATWDLESNRRS